MNISTEQFIIRPVQPHERDAILNVYRQCEDFLALGPVSTASMEMVDADLQHSRDDGGIFCGIYAPDGTMMGIVDVILSGFEGNPAHAFLSLLMIAQPYRSSGLGAEVVHRVETEMLRDPQIEAILSGVQVNNPGGIRFWQRMGYRITSGPKDFPDGTTAYALRKDR
jgi:ribosomal protein S18 acetylase RimI-like enzyme